MAKKKTPVKAEKKERFPRNLYKKGGDLVLYSNKEKYEYSTVIVESEEGFEVALKEGYKDDFSCVISEGVEEAAEKDDDF